MHAFIVCFSVARDFYVYFCDVSTNREEFNIAV